MKKVLYITEYDIGDFVSGDYDKILLETKSPSEAFKIPILFSRGVYNITIIISIIHIVKNGVILLNNDYDYTTVEFRYNNIINYNIQHQFLCDLDISDKYIFSYGNIIFLGDFAEISIYSRTSSDEYSMSSLIYHHRNLFKFSSISTNTGAIFTFKLLLEKI